MRQLSSNRVLRIAVVVLAVAVVVLGYLYYQERQRSAEFRIQLDLPGGGRIEGGGN